MYALFNKPSTVFVVNWPRSKSVEDITRYLARMGDECPYEWDVKVDRRCGSISVTLNTGHERLAVAQCGKLVEITAKGGWTNYNDAYEVRDLAYAPQGDCVGSVYDAEDLDDLRVLADRGHRVIVRLDHVIVDRETYSGFILEDECGCLSDLPYDDPHDYAIAMDLNVETVSMSE